MKTQTTIPPADRKPILVFYWFISNRHNESVFAELRRLQKSIDSERLRIVGLNPFNGEEDIEHYRLENNLPFELEKDKRHSSMFYQINTYPTFLLMEKNGRILHRQSGWHDNALEEISVLLKTGPVRHEACREVYFAPEPYHKNLSLKYKNK